MLKFAIITATGERGILEAMNNFYTIVMRMRIILIRYIVIQNPKRNYVSNFPSNVGNDASGVLMQHTPTTIFYIGLGLKG